MNRIAWLGSLALAAYCVAKPVCAQGAAPSPAATLPPAPSAAQRVALVIGNGSYAGSPLRNPVRDAHDVAEALRSTGFRVTLRENVGLRAMADAVRAFGDSLRGDDVALFYFAGHGVQVRDRNYLIPVDADIQREDEIPYASLDVNQILDKMERARSRVNIVILDACRNNPFARSFRGLSQGLAQMEAPVGTLIAYATAPGKVALDGERNRNGIYTAHLLSNLRTPGLAVELMFKRVREGVTRATNGAQTPWESSSLRGEFAFVGSTAAANPVAPAARTGRNEAFEAELAFWESLKASTSAADYEAYLQQYPEGHFAPLARARIANLRGDRPPTLAQRPPAAPAQVAKANAQSEASSSRAATGARHAALLPSLGDSWTYRLVDGFGVRAVTTLTYKVESLTEQGVGESLVVGGAAPFPVELMRGEPRIVDRPGLDFDPPDVAPYLQAFYDLSQEAELPVAKRRIQKWPGDAVVKMPLRFAGKESVTVPAGTFDSIKVAGVGSVRGSVRSTVDMHLTIWYAPAVKRFVKLDVRIQGSTPRELSTFELVRYQLAESK